MTKFMKKQESRRRIVRPRYLLLVLLSLMFWCWSVTTLEYIYNQSQNYRYTKTDRQAESCSKVACRPMIMMNLDPMHHIPMHIVSDYRNEEKDLPMLEIFYKEMEDHSNDHHVFRLKDPTTNECVPAEDWQTHSFPTCNSIHEIGGDIISGTNELMYGTRGGTLDVWFGCSDWEEKENKVVFKTQRFLVDRPSFLFSGVQFESQRKGAVSLERLSGSKNVANIYGYCGMSTLNEFLPQSLARYLKNRGGLSQETKLTLAKEAAQGLFDAHYLNGKSERPIIIHNDIATANFMINSDSKVVLNDFNASFFLARNVTSGENCEVYRNHGRKTCDHKVSPEKCMSNVFINEKVDVYHFGNVLDAITKNDRQNRVMQSISRISDSCKAADPNDRPSIEQVLHSLNQISLIGKVLN